MRHGTARSPPDHATVSAEQLRLQCFAQENRKPGLRGASYDHESSFIPASSIYSNPEFTRNPDLRGTRGADGGAVGPGGSGTENYPPGANGPEMPGSSATGSTMGGVGD